MAGRPLISLDDRWKYGSVYFMRDIETGLVKIGYSRLLRSRIGQIRRAIGRPVVLLASVVGSLDLEWRLHADLSETRVHGEWFAKSDRLMAYVDAIRIARPITPTSYPIHLTSPDAPWLLWGCD